MTKPDFQYCFGVSAGWLALVVCLPHRLGIFSTISKGSDKSNADWYNSSQTDWSSRSARNNSRFKIQDFIKMSTSLCETLDAVNPVLYPSIDTILWIMLTMPVTSATAERSFSVLRRLKTYVLPWRGGLFFTRCIMVRSEVFSWVNWIHWFHDFVRQNLLRIAQNLFFVSLQATPLHVPFRTRLKLATNF
jgi:hypothetical protein